MGIKHATVKAPGQQLLAVTDWNPDHIVDSNIDISPFNFTTTGTINNLTLDAAFGPGSWLKIASPTIHLIVYANSAINQSVLTTSSPTFMGVITPEINDNTAQDLKLWETLAIDNGANGQSLWIYRNAPEQKGYWRFYIDQYRRSIAAASFKFTFIAAGSSLMDLSTAGLDFYYNMRIRSDSKKLYLGAGSDASIHYNGANMIIDPAVVGAGSLLIGDGTANYSAFSPTGDLTFVGSAGLPFGEIYAHSVTVALTSVAQNDWDQILAFDTNGESNNTTPDHTNDHITITKAGKYLVSFQWSGYSAAVPHDWDFHISKNNNAVQFNESTQHQTSSVASRLYSVSATAIITCAVNDTIELWVKRTSAGGNIVLTTTACNITLTQIGG